MTKRMAMTTDGRMTYCSAPPEAQGRGRCNHIGHQKEDESMEQFLERVSTHTKKNVRKLNHEEAVNKIGSLVNRSNLVRFLKNQLNDKYVDVAFTVDPELKSDCELVQREDIFGEGYTVFDFKYNSNYVEKMMNESNCQPQDVGLSCATRMLTNYLRNDMQVDENKISKITKSMNNSAGMQKAVDNIVKDIDVNKSSVVFVDTSISTEYSVNGNTSNAKLKDVLQETARQLQEKHGCQIVYYDDEIKGVINNPDEFYYSSCKGGTDIKKSFKEYLKKEGISSVENLCVLSDGEEEKFQDLFAWNKEGVIQNRPQVCVVSRDHDSRSSKIEPKFSKLK